MFGFCPAFGSPRLVVDYPRGSRLVWWSEKRECGKERYFVNVGVVRKSARRLISDEEQQRVHDVVAGPPPIREARVARCRINLLTEAEGGIRCVQIESQHVAVRHKDTCEYADVGGVCVKPCEYSDY